jgi:hypothetical protein
MREKCEHNVAENFVPTAPSVNCNNNNADDDDANDSTPKSVATIPIPTQATPSSPFTIRRQHEEIASLSQSLS